MSLLSQEQHAEIVRQLSSEPEMESESALEEEPEEEFEEGEGEEEYEAQDEEPEPEEESEEDSYEASDEESEEQEEEVAEGHRVPYERFRKVNQHRRDLEERLSMREAELQRLQGQMESQRREPRAQRRDNENHYDTIENDDVAWGVPTESVDNQAIEALQVRVAGMELDKEIRNALSQYPEVPEDYLWESIASDGTQQAVDLAAGYSSFVAEIEERAISRHLEALQEEEEQVQNSPAPPRIARRRTVRSSPEEEEGQILTLDQAKEAMVAYLKD